MGQAETIGDCLAAYVFYFRCFRTGFRSVTEYPTTSEISLDGFSVPLLLATRHCLALTTPGARDALLLDRHISPFWTVTQVL